MRTLGLIGGTSWHSTVVYYRLINELVAEELGTSGNPPMVIHSLNIELMRRGNRSEIQKRYLEVGQDLNRSGAEAIIICANTPHLVYPYLRDKISIPILHIADATAQEANRLGIKHLGLIGNKPTMTGDSIRPHLLDRHDISTIIPDNFAIDRAHYFVSNELTQGRFTEEAKAFFLEQIENLTARGAEGIILGCTELPMLLDSINFSGNLLPTTSLHAKLAADFIINNN
ncbi:MAG: amino acid racemase [Saprospiraceae bacterium]|nr:amino acid racemase [Saprospiraceae bacterium]